jgi:hypothetical protein
MQGAGVRSIPATGDDKGKIYSADAIATLKGFNNTFDIKELQPIWAMFQATKNVDVHRRHLQFGMEKWAKAQGVELDRGIYFEQKTIEDIVNLRFNPGARCRTVQVRQTRPLTPHLPHLYTGRN